MKTAMRDKVKISVLQMNIALSEAKKNYSAVHRLAALAMGDAPDILLLPELWPCGFYPWPITLFATEGEKLAHQLLSELAKEYCVNIIGGTVPHKAGARFYNTSYIFDRAGQLMASYNKTHLFSPMGENKHFTAGDNLALFHLAEASCGLMVCYDLRFPELARSYALQGAEIICVPAAWPLKRLDHWRVLLEARAIENQVFIVSANGVGRMSDDSPMAGHSMIIDPWGKILAEAGEDEAIITAELDIAAIGEIRESINVFADRRPGIYQLE